MRLYCNCVLVAVLLVICSILFPKLSVAGAPSEIYAEQVKRFVKDGNVNYTGWKKEISKLDIYLDFLAKDNPLQMSEDVQIAYYINAYNAWVVKLILDHFPGISSIKDIGGLFKSPMHIKFIKIGDELYSLDNIRNGIIRKRYRDPRILFTLNTATKGCPPLVPEVYQGDKLEQQLSRATFNYVNNPTLNYMEGDTLYLSKVFDWYEDDFGGESGMIRFVRKYIRPEWKARIDSAGDKLSIRYVDYNWALNGN